MALTILPNLHHVLRLYRLSGRPGWYWMFPLPTLALASGCSLSRTRECMAPQA
ncbi:hypothetical protein WKI72_17535 [Candidatus Erwinia dacicola]